MAKKQKKKISKKAPAVKAISNPKYAVWIIAFFSAFLYMNTSDHGYVLDDMSVIEQNWVVKQGSEGIPTIFKTSYRHGYWNEKGTLYRPLTLAMYALEWEFSPNNPGLSHKVNILLYALLCALLYLFLLEVFKNQHWLLSFVTVLLFAAHPIHTEVVANIKSRDEILALGLTLCAIYLFLKKPDQKLLAWVLAPFLFFMALLAKESAVTFLAVVPLLFYFFKKERFRSSLVFTSILGGVLVIYLLIRFSVLGHITGGDDLSVLDNMLVGASFIERVSTVVKLTGFYLLKLVIPYSLSNDYSISQIEMSSLSDPYFYLSLVVIVGLLYWAYVSLKTDKIISFSLLYFFVTFSLYSNFIFTIGSSFGERFMFIPSVGFSLLLAHLLIKFVLKTGLKSIVKVGDLFSAKHMKFSGILLVILALYSFKTIDRNKAWSENFVLYETDVKTSNKSARSHYYYGLGLMKERAIKTSNQQLKEQLLRQSIEEFKEAVSIYPKYSEAYGSLGLAHYRLGETQKAIEAYDKALEFGPNAIVLNNKAVILFGAGMYKEALAVYELAVRADPRYQDALTGLASTHGMLGNNQEAIKYFSESLKYDPDNAQTYYYLGITYNNLGDEANAKKHFDRAYQLNPSLRK